MSALAPPEEVLDQLTEFYHDYYRDEIGELLEHYPREQESLHVDYQDLWRFDADIADDYLDNPESVNEWLEDALGMYDVPVDVDLSGANVRVTNLPDEKVYDVGQYTPKNVVDSIASVRGQVTHRSERQLRIVEAAFECQRCGTLTHVPQHDESFQTPGECSGCERNGPFIRKDDQSKLVNHQYLRLQTLPESSYGTTTDDIDITLTGDLVGGINPGDRIAANSLIKGQLKSENDPLLKLHGEAQSIEKLEADHEDIDTTPYLDRIREVAESSDPGPYEQIIDSIAPSHKGDERIKLALALQLFGGVGAQLPDGSDLRGTIHIALIGDPGGGKSQLLNYVNNIAPRSIYTSGKQSSSAGLTAAAVQSDNFGGSAEWSLEAGALVEAHGGVACIDELDKMSPSDQSGMLECMSDQTVSISKAGINATLPASTTILAAANPKDGRFNRHDETAEQLGIGSVLLSRFDLIFTLSDEPDEEKDREIANHMTRTARVGEQVAGGESPDEHLKESVSPALEPELLRAYIAHARTIHPRLTDNAAQLIEEEYTDLRDSHDEGGPIPTTAREVEAVRRLGEAAARIRLSERVETQDIERAVSIWRACLADLGMNEDGDLDVDIFESGVSHNQRQRRQSLKQLVSEMVEESGEAVPREDILDSAEAMGMRRSKAEHEFDKLSREGEIYEPGADGKFRRT